MAEQFSGLDTCVNRTHKIVHKCDLQHECRFAHEKDYIYQIKFHLSIRTYCTSCIYVIAWLTSLWMASRFVHCRQSHSFPKSLFAGYNCYPYQSYIYGKSNPFFFAWKQGVQTFLAYRNFNEGASNFEFGGGNTGQNYENSPYSAFPDNQNDDSYQAKPFQQSGQTEQSGEYRPPTYWEV